jgi:hypothetical protein
VVRKPADQVGFAVLPRRWVVERTSAWLMRHRRLVRDYERLATTHEAMVKWVMIGLMARRCNPVSAGNHGHQNWPNDPLSNTTKHRGRVGARPETNVGKVAAARKLLTPAYYGLRDGQIRSPARGAAAREGTGRSACSPPVMTPAAAAWSPV